MNQHQPIQVLSPTGDYRIEDIPEQYVPYLDLIDEHFLSSSYQQMLQVRTYDSEMAALQRQGQLALWVPIRGQEAGQIGVAQALKTDDMVFPSYREHAIAHVRGLDLVKINSLFRGITHGGWDPKEHNFHLYTLVIGTQSLHATGYAMGINFDAQAAGQTEHAAVLSCHGDGATSQGDTNEALIFAASFNAPVVFFVQNNNWAISVPVEVQSKVPLYQRAQGFGVPSVQVDGNDVIASHIVGSYWLDQARAGNGPALIEAKTFRLGAHTSSDDPTKYQTDELLKSWEARDPLIRLKAHLQAQGFSEEFFVDAETQAKDLASDIRQRTLELRRDSLENYFDTVYVTDHSLMKEQKSWFKQYTNQLESGGQQ